MPSDMTAQMDPPQTSKPVSESEMKYLANFARRCGNAHLVNDLNPSPHPRLDEDLPTPSGPRQELQQRILELIDEEYAKAKETVPPVEALPNWMAAFEALRRTLMENDDSLSKDDGYEMVDQYCGHLLYDSKYEM